jgi:hypothetical protein
MLEEISRNDYGRQLIEHLAGIEAQLGATPPLGLLPWNPREVLELERWTEPDQPIADQMPSGERGHFKRLLACTILLRNVGHVHVGDGMYEEEFFVESSAATVIQLVLSAIALEEDAPEYAARLLLWVYVVQAHPALRPFAAFGVLLLAAHSGPDKLARVNLAGLCSWVLAIEAQCREALGDGVASERWLLGLNIYEKEDGENRWAHAASSILTQEATRDLVKRFAWPEG